MQYVKTTFAADATAPARRWRCPARCRASCRRRSRRAPAGYLQALDQGHRQPRREGRAARRDRVARDRPAAVAGRSPRASRPRRASALAKSTVERWEALRKKDVVSQQELDERRSGDAQATRQPRRRRRQRRAAAPAAGLQARHRAVRRRHHQAQRRRRRPDRRRSGKTLFVLTQMDPLRVYVNVPQSYAQLVKPGQKVVVTQAELRGQPFAGEVARTVGVDRPGDADDAGRDHAAEQGRRAAARRLRPGRAAARRSSGRWSCRPTCCCSAAKARASPWSTRRNRSTCKPVTLGPQPRRGDRGHRRHRGRRPAGRQSVGFARRRRRGRGGGERGRRHAGAARPARAASKALP